jgi:tRNA(fMet)-specific endonuclease VapC
MTSYLLDTNHASPLVTISHPLRQRVLQAIANGDSVATVTPIVTEVAAGFLILPRSQSNQDQWERFRSSLRIFPVDYDIAWQAALLRVSARQRGRQLATIDALTAAVALRERLTLLTTDRDFSAVPDLRLENWLATIS